MASKDLASKKAAQTRPATADDEVGSELMQASAVNVSLNLSPVGANDVWGANNNSNLTALAGGITALSNQFAQYLPTWQPNTAYAQGALVLGPPGSVYAGQPITANSAFTSGASFVAANWTSVLAGMFDASGAAAAATTSTALRSTLDSVYGLPDTSKDASGNALASGATLTMGATAVAPAAGTYNAPALGTAGQRFGIRNNTAAPITLSMPNTSGTVLALTVLPGEARTYRQVGTVGFALDSGIPLAQQDARFAPGLSVLARQFPGVQVADACIAWGDPVTVNTQGTGRFDHIIGLTSDQIRLVFVNSFNANTTFVDTDGTASITFSAGIEIAGTIYRVTFGGRVTATLDPGALIVSDPLDITVAAGTRIWSRTFLNTGTAPTIRTSKGSAGTGGFSAGATDLSAPGSAAIGANTSGAFAPVAILGNPATARPLSVVGVGDSRMEGFRDDAGVGARAVNPFVPSWGGGGPFQRALSGVGGFVNLGRPSDTATGFNAANGHFRRGAMIPAARRAVVNYGINNFLGGATVDTVANANLTLGAKLKRNGMLTAHLCTLEPVAALGTDLGATVVGQTTDASNPNRVTYNNWVRSGAPVDPTTLLRVAVGTAGAITYGQSGPGGTHPYDGYFELADAVESARDSGTWKGAERFVTDASMSSSSNVTTITSATAAFTNADIGKDVNIAGAGASGANLYGVIVSITDANDAVISAGALTAVSNARLVINPWTPEGIHGNQRSSLTQATLLKPQLTALP